MSERQTFRVITYGKLIPNHFFQDVVQGLVLEFSLSPSKASAICHVSSQARTLKSGLSANQAQSLHQSMKKIGLDTQVVPMPQTAQKTEVVFTLNPENHPSEPTPNESRSSRQWSPSSKSTNPPLRNTAHPSRHKTIRNPTTHNPTPQKNVKPRVEMDRSSRQSLLDSFASNETPSWQTMDSLREIPLQYSGSASEFINMWHRHWLLSLLSLGLFWPWAQVRQQRYFWSRLSVDGVPFDYLGRPWGLLLSQTAILFSVALLVGVVFSESWWMPLSDTIKVMGIVTAAMIIAIAARFRFFYHWRHLSFGGEKIHWFGLRGYAYFYLLLAPILSLITLGVLTPYSIYAIHSDQINRLCIGRTIAQFDGVMSDYFDCGFRTLAWVIAFGVGIVGLLALFDWQLWWLGSLVGLLVLWVVVIYLRQQYFILALKSTDVDGVGFDMHHRLFNMANDASDLIMMILTLGLITPWIRFRRWQTYCDHLRFLYAGSLKDWIKTVHEKNKSESINRKKMP